MTSGELPLLVGESPSKSGDRYYRLPLSGAPARTLCQVAGWDPDGPAAELGSWTWALYARFATRNVLTRYADATPWDATRARDRASILLGEAIDDERPAVVMLGRKVATAFGVAAAAYFDWVDLRGVRGVVLPHPSGRNLLLNDARIRVAMGNTLRAAADTVNGNAPDRYPG